MKTKILIGGFICAAAIIGIFYACKKNETDKNPTQVASATNSNQTHAGQLTNARFSGTKYFYSKDDNGTVWKMQITGNTSGDMTVTRSTYSTTQPDTIPTKIFIEQESGNGITIGGLDATGTMTASTATISCSSTHTYYVIPFKGGETPVEIVNGGTGDIDVYCQLICSNGNCTLKGFFTMVSTVLYCDTDCICELVSTGCGSSPSGSTTNYVSPWGGYVLIEVNSLTVNS
jgi:uncharacterized protein (UPF0333 family)